ncbi:MAG: hypothetical protein LBK50_01925 [Candidatus Nomurabacteria bacterium]|jgi:hypothetical protein|nr:hypothetical protein [Candidatus Nomurabacteria bacterium]
MERNDTASVKETVAEAASTETSHVTVGNLGNITTEHGWRQGMTLAECLALAGITADGQTITMNGRTVSDMSMPVPANSIIMAAGRVTNG